MADPETPDRPEVIKIMHIKVAREGGERAVANPIRVSTWIKLVRATAYAQRFITHTMRPTGELRNEELDVAEIELLREAQYDLKEEMKLIRGEQQHKISKRARHMDFNCSLMPMALSGFKVET